MKFEQGKLVRWLSKDNSEVVWMVTDDSPKGVVIHSDGLMRIGTISDLSVMDNIEPFVGTVNIVSQSKE